VTGRLLLGIAVLLAGAGAARGASPSVGIRAGSLGLGPELSLPVGPQARLRLGAAGLGYGSTYNDTGIDYDADLTLRHGLVLLDWHPGGSLFRLTAGAAYNDNRLVVTAPIEDLLRRERPGLPPVGVDLGILRGTAAGEPWGPYLGLGLGRAPTSGRWSLSLDLGAIYHGRPSVRLEADTLLPIDLIPGGREELERLRAEEERALQDELASYRYLPAVSVGLAYSF
jgi:hypothetical protein